MLYYHSLVARGLEEKGFHAGGRIWSEKKQGISSKALGRFEKALTLAGVKCQGIAGDKGGEKYTGVRT